MYSPDNKRTLLVTRDDFPLAAEHAHPADVAARLAAHQDRGPSRLDDVAAPAARSRGFSRHRVLLGKARSQGRAVRAAGLTTHYQHIFEITRLSDFIEIVQPVGK